MADDVSDGQTVSYTNPVFGSLKISGATINTIFTVLGFALLVLLSWILWDHHALAKDNDKSVAIVLKENNKIVADALKESSQNTIRAIERLTEEQKKSTSAIKEGNCLNDPTMKNRADAREFCKRIVRDQ
jgi:cell division protein YceG involved in septum cleavage